MDMALDERAVARQPQQQRAIDRFEMVLQAAGELLLEAGLSGFSIPAIAQRLGITRASIYKFFPTPYAILNELAQRHLAALEQTLWEQAAQLAPLSWEEVIRRIVRDAAAFHNANPVGMMLAMGGAVTDESYRSYALTLQHLGTLAEQLLLVRGIDLSAARINAPALAVDLGSTCFRHSYLLHRHITPAYQETAADVMIDFITAELARAAGRAREPAGRRG